MNNVKKMKFLVDVIDSLDRALKVLWYKDPIYGNSFRPFTLLRAGTNYFVCSQAFSAEIILVAEQQPDYTECCINVEHVEDTRYKLKFSKSDQSHEELRSYTVLMKDTSQKDRVDMICEDILDILINEMFEYLAGHTEEKAGEEKDVQSC